jgi:preprotein translocase subunit Sec63
MDFQRCCDVLDLTPPVAMADLKEAYKDLVQVWHPDRFAHNPRLRLRAEEKIKVINLAYETLDHFLSQQQARQQAQQKPPSPTTSRTTANPIHTSGVHGWGDRMSLKNKALIYGVLVLPATWIGLLVMFLLASMLAAYPVMIMVLWAVAKAVGFKRAMI